MDATNTVTPVTLLQKALTISEEEYHALPYLSYSCIKRYLDEGIDCIPHLFEPTESTPSLALGSALDCKITTPQEWDSKFYIFDASYVATEKTAMVITDIHNALIEHSYRSLPSILADNDSRIQSVIEGIFQKHKFYSNLTLPTIKRKLNTEECEAFWRNYSAAHGRTMLTYYQGETLNNMLLSLHNHPIISKLFFNQTREGIDRYYQLKFTAEINGHIYKVMFDMLVVNHNTKTIYPYDLKTTSLKASEFWKAFVKFRYDIQCRLYTRVLKEVIKGTTLENYTIRPFTNIVVSSKDLQSRLFVDYHNHEEGEIKVLLKNGVNLVFPDPVEVGEEMYRIMDNELTEPPYISKTEYNDTFKLIMEHYE